jgi:hypothetical protein
VLACLFAAARPAWSQEPRAVEEDRVNAAVRAAIEPRFRERTGAGFESFRCDSGARPRPGGFLDCDAVLENGHSLRLVLAIDDAGHAEVVLASRLVSGMDAAERTEMEGFEPPCEAFLKASHGSEKPPRAERSWPTAEIFRSASS